MASKLTKIIAVTTLAAVAGCSGVYAHKGMNKGADRAERMFERMDTDNDGIVSIDDAKALAAVRFAAMDTDGNGEITRSERRDFRQSKRTERRAERFARLDTDGDGMISLEDMKNASGSRAERRFARLDTDGDGLVSLDDMQAMQKQRGMRGKHEKGHAHREGGRKGPMTLEKMESRMLKRFARIDTDGDGQITLEDVKAAGPLRRRG